jgi:hypothetical protein
MIQAFSDSPQQGFVMIIHRAIQHHRDLSGMTQVFPTASLFHVAQPRLKTGDFSQEVVAKSGRNTENPVSLFVILHNPPQTMVFLWESLRSIPSHSIYHPQKITIF